MKKIGQAPVFICFLVWILSASAQEPVIRPALLKGDWSARWISCPGIVQRAYGVFHFRKVITINSVPEHFMVHLSADNRYRLFVNGKAVCSGPARGDLAHWNFETIDLAPFLTMGENILAALVWNMGEFAAVAQISNQTAFLMQGDGPPEEIANTNTGWKVIKDSAYTPCATDMGSLLHTYYAAGPGDAVNEVNYPWGWEQPGYADKDWKPSVTIASPAFAGYGSDNRWTLVPRTIPLMQETLQRIPAIRRWTTGYEEVAVKDQNDGFLRGRPTSVPAHSSVVILLDQGFNTVAYPQLLTSKGRGSRLTITYSEALFDSKFGKGNRNEIEHKKVIGNFDIIKPDGGDRRLFRPLWMRTYRYLQLEIQTGDEPLVLEDMYGMYTGYPFKENATFGSNDPSLKAIWDVGWRTARLCAGETYFDCPYYEQLQYEADTRIQALISLYVSGDDRLMRKAITDFFNSRVSEGLTQGRYPSNRLQVIPPFSLFWISMIHDYWMHRKDDAFIRQNLFAVKDVLEWYEKRIDPEKKILGPMKWWNFVDWNLSFPGGTPDGADEGNSSIISLQFSYTLQQAAALFGYFGDTASAMHYTRLADTLSARTYALCFDPVKAVMANTPARSTFSQHASIMGILAGSIPKADVKAVMGRILHDSSLSAATFYYRFYLTRALKVAGMADLYYSSLKPWRDMIAGGLTTFAENPDPTRSDCHAWSASPVYDFLSTLCGIVPGSPGFATVDIRPALGALSEVHGSMPHPMGVITVAINRKSNGGVRAEIELPPTVIGRFFWNGREVALHAGRQLISL